MVALPKFISLPEAAKNSRLDRGLAPLIEKGKIKAATIIEGFLWTSLSYLNRS